MFRAILKALGLIQTPPRPDPRRVLADLDAYPPEPVAYPFIPVPFLLEHNHSLIKALKNEMSVDPFIFQTSVLPLIARAAEYFHLLPSSEHYHHRRKGGAFSHALEVAQYAVRLSEAYRPTGLPLPDKMKARQHFQLACLLRALFHDVGKPISDIIVYSGNHRWTPTHETLSTWACRNQLLEYHVRWLPDRINGYHDRFTASQLANLTHDFELPIPAELHALLIATLSDPEHLISKIIKEADQNSVALDTHSFRRADQEAPPHTLVLEAIRELLAKYPPNHSNSPFWISDHGLHVVYPNGLQSVIEHLARTSRATGLPPKPHDLGCLLLSSGTINGTQIGSKSAMVERIQFNYRSQAAEPDTDLNVVTFHDLRPFAHLRVVPVPLIAYLDAAGQPVQADKESEAHKLSSTAAPATKTETAAPTVAKRSDGMVMESNSDDSVVSEPSGSSSSVKPNRPIPSLKKTLGLGEKGSAAPTIDPPTSNLPSPPTNPFSRENTQRIIEQLTTGTTPDQALKPRPPGNGTKGEPDARAPASRLVEGGVGTLPPDQLPSGGRRDILVENCLRFIKDTLDTTGRPAHLASIMDDRIRISEELLDAFLASPGNSSLDKPRLLHQFSQSQLFFLAHLPQEGALELNPILIPYLFSEKEPSCKSAT